jgi:hypothetical protein
MRIRNLPRLGGGGVVVGAEPASFEAVRGAAEARAEVGGGQAGRGAGNRLFT